jgi:hypothetical protein
LKVLHWHNKTSFSLCHFLRGKEIPVFKVTVYYIRVVFKHDPRKERLQGAKKWERGFSGGPLLLPIKSKKVVRYFNIC